MIQYTEVYFRSNLSGLCLFLPRQGKRHKGEPISLDRGFMLPWIYYTGWS